jgi:hypothetical protein
MRKVESLLIKYIGYDKPESLDEAELEILGLETAIATAKQRISVIQQSLKLQSLIKNSVVEDEHHAQTVTETNSI